MEGQNGGEEWQGRGKKAMNGLLAHPFPCENGLLFGKGWTKRPFSGDSSSQGEALRAFPILLGHFGVILGHFGAFWGLKPPNLLSLANR